MPTGTARWSAEGRGLRRDTDAVRSRKANLPMAAWPAVKAPPRSVENKAMDAFDTVTATASGFASRSAPLGRNS